jgi:ACS family hexuronate transporter-like MFS transporter
MDTSRTVSDTSIVAGARRPWRYWGILLLLFLAGVLNYIDRQTLSVLKPLVKSALNTDEVGYAFLVNVFTFCYAGAYMATGWITDRIGARVGFIVFIVLWSLATIGCGFANTFVAFAICRGLLGLAEPGNQPVTIRALTLWVPVEKRGLIMSLVGSGGTVGSVAAAPVVAWLATSWGWHAAFLIPGVLGLVVGTAWWFIYRHPSRKAPASSGLPIEEPLSGLSWGQLWRQRTLWGIVLARFISDPVWYFCLFWMPGYFQEQRGLSLKEAGMIGWIPFFAASVGGITLAATSDWVGRKLGNPLRGRVRVLWLLALLGPAAMLVPRVDSLGVTVALLCVVAVVCLGWLSILGPLVADAFPSGNVGSVWGIAGAFGATGAIIFNHQVGKISSAVGSENMFLILGALHLVATAVILIFVRQVRLPERSAS